MPLAPGNSREVIGRNIREMMASGYPQRQAVAASLSNARRHPRTSGGLIPHFDSGGDITNLSGFGGITPSAATSGPLTGDMLRRFQSMSPEQLQEMALRLGPNSQVGQIASRVLAQKRMVPNAQPAPQQPAAQQPAPPQVVGGLANPQQGGLTPMMAADGGRLHRAMGGMSLSMDSPWWTRAAEREATSPVGFLNSSIAGRTDHIAASPMADSYVIPADVVSGLGEGNSLAGARALELALHTGPHGIPMPNPGRTRGWPAAPRIPQDSKGGRTSGTVPCLLAGGEFVVHPQAVAAIGGGDVKRGHKILDAFVLHARRKTINEMKRLPGPAK